VNDIEIGGSGIFYGIISCLNGETEENQRAYSVKTYGLLAEILTGNSLMRNRSANLYTVIYIAFHTLFAEKVSQTVTTKEHLEQQAVIY
jgi:hypothetical protein